MDASDFLGVWKPLVRPYILYRKIRREFCRRILKSPDVTSRVYDYRLCLPLRTSGIGSQLAGNGFRELDQRYVCQKVVTPNSVIFDLGSNIGYYVVMFMKLMKNTGFIYAIEPDPRSLEYLEKNITLNGIKSRMRIDQVALSDHNGIGSFQLATATNLSGLGISSLPRSYVDSLEVPLRDFGQYLASIPQRIDLVRMDVEGHELQILGSLVALIKAQQSIHCAPRKILFEGHVWEYFNSSGENQMRPIIEQLFRFGYRARYLCTAVEHTSPVRSRGYKPEVVIDIGFRCYGVYANLGDEDAIDLISEEPGITTICLEIDSSEESRESDDLISGMPLRVNGERVPDSGGPEL